MRKLMFLALLATVATPALARPDRAPGDDPRADRSEQRTDGTDQPRPERPRFEHPRSEQPRVEQPRGEQPRFEPRVEGPRFDRGSGFGRGPGFDRGPRGEAPQPDMPRAEPPQVLTPAAPAGGWQGRVRTGDTPRQGWSGGPQGGVRHDPRWTGDSRRSGDSRWTGDRHGGWNGGAGVIVNRGPAAGGAFQPSDDTRGYRPGDGRQPDTWSQGGQTRRWSNDWHRDSRYDWRRYRDRNRFVFRLGSYYDPFGYGYRPLRIGFTLNSGYYQPDFWLDDPYEYRLPPVYGPYRWIRYFNDAVLVDIYSGEVVDVIPDFFW